MKKLVLTSFNRKNSGITSILVVIAVGMVLSIMVAGIATLSIRELRQASNTEQSKKAFQGAESAVNFAAQKLADDPNYTVDSCPYDKNSSDAAIKAYADLFGLGSQQEVTCVKVGNTFDEYYEGYLQADRAVQFYAGPNFGINGGKTPWLMSLDWHDFNNNGNLPAYNTSVFYPTVYIDHAAALEISFIYWQGSSISSTNLIVKTIFITPGNPDNGFTVVQETPEPKPAEPLVSSCVPSLGWGGVPEPKGGYACGMKRSQSTGNLTSPSTDTDLGFRLRRVLTNVGSSIAEHNAHNFIIRIKPRYRDTNIKFGLFDYERDLSTNKQKPIPFRSAQTQVDITAKSANIYRRVKASIPSRSMALDNVFDSAIYSGAGDTGSETINICKNLSLTVDPQLNFFKYVIPATAVCGGPWQPSS